MAGASEGAESIAPCGVNPLQKMTPALNKYKKYSRMQVTRPASTQTQMSTNARTVQQLVASIKDGCEVEYRLIENTNQSGITYATYLRLMLLKNIYTECFTADSLVYMTSRGVRHMFVDTSERIVATTQTKLLVSQFFAPTY